MLKQLQINNKLVLIQIGNAKISYYWITSEKKCFRIRAFDEYIFKSTAKTFTSENLTDMVTYSRSFLQKNNLMNSYAGLAIDFSIFCEKIQHENDKSTNRPSLWYRNDSNFAQNSLYYAFIEKHFLFRFLLFMSQLPVHNLILTCHAITLLEAISFFNNNFSSAHYRIMRDIYQHTDMMIEKEILNVIRYDNCFSIEQRNLMGAIGLFIMTQRIYEQK